MKRLLPVLNLIPVILLIYFSIAYIKLDSALEKRYTASYTEVITNSASDAAVEALVNNTADLGQDYDDYNEVQIDPEVGKYAFGMTLALAENMQPTKTTADQCLMEHIKILTVCADDGYYIYEAIPTSKDKRVTHYEIGGTPKLPYTYYKNDKLYALRLLGDKTLCLSGDKATEVDSKSNLLPQGANKYKYVNSLVSEEINGRVKKLYTNGWKNKVYIPASLGNLTQTNPIAGVTVLALVDGYGGNQSFGIGGTRIENKTYYIGLTLGNKKYYKKAREIDDSISVVFDSALEAAKAGYYCYIQ